MSKRTVMMFPDYCSTSLWVGHPYVEDDHGNRGNVDPEELGVSPGLQLALKYWHEVWEYFVDCGDGKSVLASEAYIQRWKQDGRKLAELMSAENDKYTFVAKY